MAYDNEQLNVVSEDIRSKLLSGDKEMCKSAGLAASEYFRTQIRENGIRRQITPPKAVTRDNFNTAEDTDFPLIYVPVAPESAGAYMLPFEAGPEGNVIQTRKVRADFNRIMTYKYSIDMIRLETYSMPLLDIFYDLMLKDIMDVEDTHWTNLDKAIVDPNGAGANKTYVPEMGCQRWVTCGPMKDITARAALVHLLKGINVGPGNLQPKQFLMNNLTYCDFAGLGREFVGGDLAQDMFVDGVKLTKVMGVDTVVTTKKKLIPTNDVFIYTDPDYYGKFFTFKDVAMVTDTRDEIWLTAFAQEVVGGVIANGAGVARGSLTGTLYEWEAADQA